MSDKKFDLELVLRITENREGDEERPFFDNTLAYHDLPYEGVVAVEAVLIEALKKLNELGFQKAVRKGGDMGAIGLVLGMELPAKKKRK